MNVYLLEDVDIDSSYPVGIYSTRGAANEAAQELKKSPYYFGHQITEFKLEGLLSTNT